MSRQPRVVRETVRSRITAEEVSKINNRLAALYFGTEWRAGDIKQPPNYRFSNPGRSIAEIINANTIILRLISEGVISLDSRLIEPAVRLAMTYMNALNEGMHFRSAAGFYDELIPILPDGFESQKASLRAFYGRSLRMLGLHERAKAELEAVRMAQPSKEATQSLLINLALCHQSLGQDSDACRVADEILKINRKNTTALQAKAIKLELSERGSARTSALKKLEGVCRRRNASVVANNIALALARENSLQENEARQILAVVLKESAKTGDHYNQVRAIVDYCGIRVERGEPLSEEEKTGLSLAYHILFNERLGTLFDRCHELLWASFVSDGDIENLLVLFRQSSLIWRLRGAEQIEKTYLKKIHVLIEGGVPTWLAQLPLQTAYYLTRTGAIGGRQPSDASADAQGDGDAGHAKV